MRSRTPRFDSAEAPPLSVEGLESCAQDWLVESRFRQHSARTYEWRQSVTTKLVWFLRQEEHAVCERRQIRAFLAYLTTAHTSEQGRWGNAANPQIPSARRPLSARTVKDYHNTLSIFFNWLVKEETIAESPMHGMDPPVAREDQVQPFTAEEVEALLAAAKRTRHAVRDTALLLFLLDTGCRASEVCALTVDGVDLGAHRCRVLGKGHKERTVYFARHTARALYVYYRERGATDCRALFLAESGHTPGEPLTRAGLLRRIHTLGEMAGLKQAGHPHRFRHTFAVNFLRAGGNILELKEFLGHTSLGMVQRYVQLANADLESAHREHSPVEFILGRKSR